MLNHKFIQIISLALLALCSLSSCSTEPIYYNDAEYVMFADSVTVMPVLIDGEVFEVQVASTVSRPYDRVFAVEVLETQSNVVENYHYKIENANVVIKAGERCGNLRIAGVYDNINERDSLCLQLKLLAEDHVKQGLYSDRIKIAFRKCYPFNIDDYVGNLRMYAAFPFSSTIKTYLRKAQKRTENSMIIKAPFTYGYDLILYFDGSDPLYPMVTVKEQYAMVDSNYGRVSSRTIEQEPSFFDGGGRNIFLKMEFFVAGVGNFGSHGFVFEWITPQEAALMENGIL